MEGADNRALLATVLTPSAGSRVPGTALEEAEPDLMGRERTPSHTWHRLGASVIDGTQPCAHSWTSLRQSWRGLLPKAGCREAWRYWASP